MSILIKGMEMPKNCGDCQFVGCCGAHPVDEWPDIESIVTNDVIGTGGERDKNCPLVPIPPHGDLIDRDPFIEFIKTHWDSYDQWFVEQLETRPTIIPAEEGEA